MEDLERLLACEEIRQLAYRYALATDSRDIDALVDLFVEDVRVGRATPWVGKPCAGTSSDSFARWVSPSSS